MSKNIKDASSVNKAFSMKKLMSVNGIGVVVAYVVLFIFLSLTASNFCTISNFLIVVRQSVFVALMGIGMTFVIAMAGIDLSVGAILGISGAAVAALILGGVNIYLALIITLVFGALLGFINGLLITKVKLAPFIATLGTMSILRGLIMVYTGGIPIYGLRFEEFQFIAQGSIGVIPFPIILLIIITAIFYYVLYHTRLGRYTLSIGSNEDAASLVGINIDRIQLIVYTICGLMCAGAGIMMTSRTEAAVAQAGSGYELDVIAATVIGGTGLSGGKANLLGTILGAILMTTVRNGLNLLSVNTLWHQVVIGVFIICAVSFDRLSSRNEIGRN